MNGYLMAEITEKRVLNRMRHGVTYWQADILKMLREKDEERRCECLEVLGYLVQTGRVIRSYARGVFSYVKASQDVIEQIDQKEKEPPKPFVMPTGNYGAFRRDLLSHAELAMLARRKGN